MNSQVLGLESLIKLLQHQLGNAYFVPNYEWLL